MKGACGQDNCPYAHSYVGHDAKVCEDFLQGFCAKGTEVCKKNIFFTFVFYIYLNLNNKVFETTCSLMSAIRVNGSVSSW